LLAGVVVVLGIALKGAMGSVAAVVLWTLIITAIVWGTVRLTKRSTRSGSIGPTASSPPQWMMCEKCGGGSYPGATYCQWCAAPLTPPRAVLTPEPPLPAPSAAPPNTPSPVTVVAPPASDPMDSGTTSGILATTVSDELARLAGLHDAGKLTDDEFAAFKAKLLE
jgi:hypothetical protein